MNEVIIKLKKIIGNHLDKKILVVGTMGSGIEQIYKKMAGEFYNQVFDELLIENFGYIDPFYIPREEQQKIEKMIEVKKGIPLFSYKIIDSDIVIFLYVNPKILRILCLKENISYTNSLNLQQKLIDELKSINKQIITLNLYDINLDNIGRNVYILDDEEYFLTDRKEMDTEYNFEDYSFRFPYIKRVTEFNDLKRKRGFLLVINEKYLSDEDYMEIDKKNRKLFNQFNLVYIITQDPQKLKMFHIRYTNIYFIDTEYLDDDTLIDTYYDYILGRKKRKFTKNKIELLDNIHLYFKDKKNIKTSELAKDFNLNVRKIERLMNDYNEIYKNIGYDYSKNEWYIIH